MKKYAPIFICRDMQEKDIDQVSMIENDAFPELFPQTQFKKELNRSQSTTIITELNTSNPNHLDLMPHIRVLNYRNGQTGWHKGEKFLTGFVRYWEYFEEIHIMSIGVRREYTKLKIGSLLLSECISRVIEKSFNKITLEVRVSNNPAIKMYTNFGFEIVGERKKFYPDNLENALIMSLSEILNPEYRCKIKLMQETIACKINYLFNKD